MRGNPEAEYHELVDVIHEAARHGDSANTLRLGDLADIVHTDAMTQGYLTASSYNEGVATAAKLSRPDSTKQIT